MSRVCRVLLLVLLISFFSGCMQNVPHGSYTNTLYGFTLDSPVGWQVVENVSEGEAVRFLPLNTSSVLFAISSPHMLDEGLALSTFADLIEEMFSQQYTDFMTLYRDWRTINGLNAYEIVYSYRENQTFLKAWQVAVQKSRTVFLMDFLAPLEEYETYVSLVNQSIEAFQII